MSRVLALDLGGTHLRAGLAAANEAASVQTIGRWPAPRDMESFRVLLGEIVASRGPFDRVGLAVPGLAEETRCRWIPNLPWLDGVDLADLVAGAPLALGNDSQLALLAEATHGAAAGLSDAILLSIGTGIGSAVLSGGRIVKGAAGGACSFGWACADMADQGRHKDGWLERMAAGRAFDAAAVKTFGAADGAALIAAARAGDQAAIEAIAKPAAAIGTALAGAVALLDPQAILFTGGVAESLDALAPAILAALRRHLPPHLKRVALRAGRFSGSAALIGAAIAGAAGRDWRSLR
ncbi:MAG TPA: ROK family protein [Roseiarcus sp.]|nr:ROK family protein [Roseiarcus sp.]